MTYLWIPALPIAMQTDEARLVSFMWEGRRHRVRRVARRWRVDVEWWRGRVWRDYYKLLTDTGLLVIVFHDLLDGRWYLQQLFD